MVSPFWLGPGLKLSWAGATGKKRAVEATEEGQTAEAPQSTSITATTTPKAAAAAGIGGGTAVDVIGAGIEIEVEGEEIEVGGGEKVTGEMTWKSSSERTL